MKTHMATSLRRFVHNCRAVSALEYAILVGVVTVAIGAAVATFSSDLQTVIEDIGDSVQTRDTLVGNSVAPTTPTP